MNNTNTIPNITIIIARKRGWRKELADAIKNFPPHPADIPANAVDVIEIRHTARTIIINKRREIH